MRSEFALIIVLDCVEIGRKTIPLSNTDDVDSVKLFSWIPLIYVTEGKKPSLFNSRFCYLPCRLLRYSRLTWREPPFLLCRLLGGSPILTMSDIRSSGREMRRLIPERPYDAIRSSLLDYGNLSIFFIDEALL